MCALVTVTSASEIRAAASATAFQTVCYTMTINVLPPATPSQLTAQAVTK
jgi:hypothetical protein